MEILGRTPCRNDYQGAVDGCRRWHRAVLWPLHDHGHGLDDGLGQRAATLWRNRDNVELVVPNLIGNKEQADRQKAVSDITALEGALDMYKLHNGVYPTTEQGLQALVEKPTSAPEPRRYQDGGYIKRLPQDPWGRPYIYRQPGENGGEKVGHGSGGMSPLRAAQ